MIIIYILLMAAALYLAAGFLFAIAFVTTGVTKIDEAAKSSGWGFRVIIIPGCMVFWPLLLQKWRNANKTNGHD